MSVPFKVPVPEGVDPEQFRELVERLLNQRLTEAFEKEIQRRDGHGRIKGDELESPRWSA